MTTTPIPALAALLAGLLPAQEPAPKPGGIPDCTEVKTTASGLQYCVLHHGSEQPPPGPTDIVTVHYTGWLTDGTKFDSSRDRGEPTSFPLTSVIRGWTEGLQLMHQGDRFKFVIPPGLAYGDSGQGKIPPGSTLVFDVELLAVKRLPRFVAARPDQQQTSKSGLKYEYLTVGTGPQVGEGEAVSFRFAAFADSGDLLICSEQRNDQRLAGTVESLPLPFLRELAPLLKVGDVLRVEVPAKDLQNVLRGLKPEGFAVWEVELVGVNKLPPFVLPKADELTTTESGLQHKQLKAGTGARPTASSTVKVHYTGWLTNGTLFDSSHARGEPARFPLNGVIKGWTEGLQLLQAGGSCILLVPPELGYGSREMGNIPPNSTLVFLVELLEVQGVPSSGDR